nr:MAG TPA: 6-pyruvoyl tetrahydropterin synthase [Caudoviricetes sp.]
MWARINRNEQANIIVPTETTIEYLAEFVAHRMMSALLLAKVREFRISEGLQKGVVYRLDTDPGNVIF